MKRDLTLGGGTTLLTGGRGGGGRKRAGGDISPPVYMLKEALQWLRKDGTSS